MRRWRSFLQRLGALFVFADDEPFRIQREPLQHVVHFGSDIHLEVPITSKNPDLIGVTQWANAAAGPQDGEVLVVCV